ncbi:MAG: NAD-dependent epimerase/dehydratase family protein [Frankiales bacterium]|nr:NAD-dependent epimerase/dehydratase family protein [Frankiales bacterium]
MRVLMIGGTRFVGRHIARAALTMGHELTLVHRTPTDLLPEAEHLLLDRDGDLGVLRDREWDATVDVSAYFPGQVASLHDALGDRGGRNLVISSTSVYAPPAAPGFDESSPTVAPAPEGTTEVTEETYGPLKVSIELLSRELYGERSTVVRPTYVIGPWDYTQRFTYWVQRVAEGGEVLAPGDPGDPIQVIDARDMGSWIVRLLEGDVAGTFHAVSPPPVFTFGELLADVVAAVAPAGTTLTWPAADWLTAQGLDDTSLPLWGAGDPWIAVNTADPAAARATGLSPRTLRQSVVEILEHTVRHPAALRPGQLTRERERELLAAWHAVS